MPIPAKPITRKEMFLNASATGDTSNLPVPITREEEYLKAIAENGGGGGGSGDVSGVKGAAESTYRKGNVNITPANIGVEEGAQVNHIIQDNSGDMPARKKVQFVDVVVQDDSTNDRTIVMPLGVKVTGTVSGNTVSFTHANVPTGAIEDPWIDGIEERIINKSISGNTITYTFADNAADGKSAYIYIRG